MNAVSTGLAADVLAQLDRLDGRDPQRLGRFIEAVGAPPQVAAVVEERVCLVMFEIDKQLFAVNVERVREVVRVEQIARVPQAPEHVRGVQSVRGRVLPVIETRTRLGLPPAEITAQSRLLVVEARHRLLGLLVDSVEQVSRVPRSKIQVPPAEVRHQLSEHVSHVAQLDSKVALLLDVDRLLVLPTHLKEASP